MEDCPICYEKKKCTEHVTSFVCKHKVCYDCNIKLKNYSIENFVEMKCPLCRAPEFKSYELFPQSSSFIEELDNFYREKLLELELQIRISETINNILDQ